MQEKALGPYQKYFDHSSLMLTTLSGSCLKTAKPHAWGSKPGRNASTNGASCNAYVKYVQTHVSMNNNVVDMLSITAVAWQVWPNQNTENRDKLVVIAYLL